MDLNGVGSRLTRINQLGGERLYRDAYSPNSFSGVWSQAYQQIMEDIRVMNALAAESGLTYYIGMGEVMQAYTLLTLVDYFGDIPYSRSIIRIRKS